MLFDIINITQKINFGDDLLILVLYVSLSPSKSAGAHENIKLVYSVIPLILNTYIWNCHLTVPKKLIITYSPEIECILRLISFHFPQVHVLVRLHISSMWIVLWCQFEYMFVNFILNRRG